MYLRIMYDGIPRNWICEWQRAYQRKWKVSLHCYCFLETCAACRIHSFRFFRNLMAFKKIVALYFTNKLQQQQGTMVHNTTQQNHYLSCEHFIRHLPRCLEQFLFSFKPVATSLAHFIIISLSFPLWYIKYMSCSVLLEELRERKNNNRFLKFYVFCFYHNFSCLSSFFRNLCLALDLLCPRFFVWISYLLFTTVQFIIM